MTKDLRMAVIFRADLPLPPGKMAVQAGHAFTGALLAASTSQKLHWQFAVDDYMDTGQTKIALIAPDLAALESIQAKAYERGIPFCTVRDAGRTVVDAGTVTCIGLGPMSKTDCNALTRGLEMM